MIHAKESPLKWRVHEASISPSAEIASEELDAAARRHGAGLSSASEPDEALLASAGCPEAEAESMVLSNMVDPKTASKSKVRVKVRVLAADGRGEL